MFGRKQTITLPPYPQPRARFLGFMLRTLRRVRSTAASPRLGGSKPGGAASRPKVRSSTCQPWAPPFVCDKMKLH